MEIVKQTYERLDEACLDELRELTAFVRNPTRFENLISLFLEGLEPQVAAMRESFSARNGIGLADLAHGLRGSAASFGALHLAWLCAQLEEGCADQGLDRACTTLEQIEHEAVAVLHILRREILQDS